MQKSYFFLLLLAVLLVPHAFAQVSVNPLTGAPGVQIPIYTISSGQVSIPVTLSYSGNGVHAKDVEGTAGMGWQLNTGGQVSRIVRGLPDDITKDNSGHLMQGWMNSLDTGANKIAGFTIANNGSTCSLETSDISYVNANFPYRNDTEPDRFFVNAPGLSCQLVYDRVSGKFKPVGYQDLVITYLRDGGSQLLSTIYVTTDKGITYEFGNDIDTFPGQNKVTLKTLAGSSASYFKTKYQQYQYGIDYYDNWSLVRMTDPNGNGIFLQYTVPSPSRPSTDSLVLYTAGSTTGTLQYRTSQINTPYTLLTIQPYTPYGNSANYLEFTWTSSPTGQTIISSITLRNTTAPFRTFQFAYSPVSRSTSGYTRYFLRNYSEPGCSSPVSYTFGYVGETKSAGAYTSFLPDSTENTYDYWGYYSTKPVGSSRIPTAYVNPSNSAYPRYSILNEGATNYPYTLSGVNRSADTVSSAVGSLNKVTTVEGTSSNIKYESNRFYDPVSGTVVFGGGVRVRQVVDSVGYHSTNNIIRNYSYINPATGLSSGKPVSLPQYAFAIPGGSGTGAALYASSTALSMHDLSDEDNTIMYTHSRVSQSGAGSTLYQYTVPATYWDSGATPSCSGCSTTEWLPVVDYIGRTSCASSYGPISNYVYSYPFIPNPNYDFERGLPVKTTSFNDAGSEVSETNYAYARSFSPSVITAFKTDDNVNGSLTVKSYNKYKVYYNTSELTATAISKVFDSPTLSVARTDTVTYTYGSANHKMVTQVQQSNSDRSVYTSKVTYAKDYAATSGSNANVTSIYNLKQKNINIPVESYQQVTRAGVTKTISAGLTLFKAVTPGTVALNLPYRQYRMVQPDGLSGFVPMGISGQVLTFDSTHYVRTANYITYDKAGFPLTADDNFKHVNTTFVDHFAGVVAQFSNAAANGVAFSDFDSDQATPAYGFTVSGGTLTTTGSHAGNAMAMTSAQTAVSATLSKSATTKNYVFSVWLTAAGAGTLTLSLSGIATHPAISYAAGGPRYYEVKIPVSTLSSSYTVSFTVNTNVTADDILFYPDEASVGTVSYDANTKAKTTATSSNGVSAYFVNDTWGRMLYTLDQDKNIVQRNTIVTAADANAHYTYSPSVGGSGTVTNTTPVSFSVTNADPCGLAGVTVSWDFGDGIKVKAAGLVSPTHSYQTAGTYTLRDTLHTLLYGDIVVAPKTITVTRMMIPLTYNNYTTGSANITAVIFTPSGGGSTYNFTGSTLQGGQVPQGNYSVQVNMTGSSHYNAGTGLGYNALVLSIQSGVYSCADWVSSNSYTFTMSLGSATTLDFQVSTFDCTHFGAGGIE
jgi:hypothetical protein